MKYLAYSIMAVVLFTAGFIAGIKFCDEEMQEMEMRSYRSNIPRYDSTVLYAKCNHRQYPKRGEINREAGRAKAVFTQAHKNKRVARPRPGTEHGC